MKRQQWRVGGGAWQPCGPVTAPSSLRHLSFPPRSAWAWHDPASKGRTALRRFSHEGRVSQHTAWPGGQGWISPPSWIRRSHGEAEALLTPWRSRVPGAWGHAWPQPGLPVPLLLRLGLPREPLGLGPDPQPRRYGPGSYSAPDPDSPTVWSAPHSSSVCWGHECFSPSSDISVSQLGRSV